MDKKSVLAIVNKYYAYHRSNKGDIKKFKLSNSVETVGGRLVVSFGVYFNFDKNLYKYKGKILYSCALTIKNPFITKDQIYTAIITKDKKAELVKNGFDSVVLIDGKSIVEVICFSNSQIKIGEITT